MLSETGETLIDNPENMNFFVNVSLAEISTRNIEDYISIVAYDMSGRMLYIKSEKRNISENDSININIPAQEKQVGSIKAYVWESFNSPVPLAESKEIIFN